MRALVSIPRTPRGLSTALLPSAHRTLRARRACFLLTSPDGSPTLGSARVVDVDELAVGPRHWAGMGVSCADYLNNVIRPAIAAGSAAAAGSATAGSSAAGGAAAAGGGGSAENRSARIFFLGPTPLPMWTRIHGTDAVEPFVFDSLNRALGIRCRKHNDGSWGVSSKSGVTPIDRYSIVGGRRRDAIHPFFNAQFAIVQLALNHLCPARR